MNFKQPHSHLNHISLNTFTGWQCKLKIVYWQLYLHHHSILLAQYSYALAAKRKHCYRSQQASYWLHLTVRKRRNLLDSFTCTW